MIDSLASEGSTGVKGFVKDAAIAAMASATLDFAVEAVGLPGLNQQSPFPIIDPQQTWMETILVGSGLVLTTLGALSVFAGHSLVPGFGKEALAYGVGILAGESFYEHQAVKFLGIRNIRHGIYK